MHNNLKSSIKVTILLVITSLVIFSCSEEEFDTIGVGILGDGNFNTGIKSYPIVAYNDDLQKIQTSNIGTYGIGTYQDEIFGNTTSNFITQLSLQSTEPIFGILSQESENENESTNIDENEKVTSVRLVIPYFSTADSVNEEGNTTYKLDSIKGEGTISFKVFENQMFLRDYDPNAEPAFSEEQKYYSNENYTLYDSSTTLFSIENLVPDNSEIEEVIDEENEETINKLSPRIILESDNLDFFQSKILDMEGSSNFQSTQEFKDFFRGIYIETTGGEDLFMLLDFDSAYIEINYEFQKTTQDNEGNIVTETDKDSFQLNLSNSSILSDGSIADTNIKFMVYKTLNSNIPDISNPDQLNGDNTLYIKGFDGVQSIIKLFDREEEGDGNNTLSLEEFQNSNLLINEAYILVHVDETQMGESLIPERLYLYNLDENSNLIDWALDQSTDINPFMSKSVFSGIFTQDTVTIDGIETSRSYYKFRITYHMISLKNGDINNDKFAIRTLSDILGNPISSTAYTPEGVILHGNDNTNKNIELNIIYSEPTNN